MDDEKDEEVIDPAMPPRRRGITLSGWRQIVTEALSYITTGTTIVRRRSKLTDYCSEDLVLKPAKIDHLQESRHISRTRRVIEGISVHRLKGHTIWYELDVFPLNSFYWRTALASVVGSVIWILSSLFSFLPFAFPSTRFPDETEVCVGLLSCTGTICFFISSLTTILHTLNESRPRYDGWKAQQIRNEFRAARNLHKKNYRVGDWGWRPRWNDIKEHWADDLAFRSCCIQLVCSLLFLEAGICAIPAIYNRISLSHYLMNCIYWSPKVFACVGFIWMGFLGLVQSHQSERRTPFWRKLSWHAGIWSTLGGIGFLIMSFLGFGTLEWMQRQNRICALWGSCAFLVSSLLLSLLRLTTSRFISKSFG
ncbi:uncharacterized protein MYCFIDRAFT_207993 [Pseudocercospora fijiensis CIRAD86]|uniref:Integral membrane protein n=1 Tax=Pseudocercospora fijiensis (strain CIRAD86) TaxID=383855 RepID=M3AWV2_PSEFD|nr:uncharacterized protein MYCFIDRAFT_207993 [Pseudocercospora fijiensis CIRAD86]EME81947.1 hypothetical protein MYCFIDRAFT_207993 [Pseudocercospora fijiensis CIRAD86]